MIGLKNFSVFRVISLVTIVVVVFFIFFATARSSWFTWKRSNVSFEEVKIDESYCFPFRFYVGVPEFERRVGKIGLDGELIISTDADYKRLLQYRRSDENKCRNENLPAIDFTQKILLGKFANAPCRSTKFIKTVVRDDASKTITYSVSDNRPWFSMCSGSGAASMNLITIPKIPPDYRIMFEPLIDPSSGRWYYGTDKGWVEKDTYGNELRVIPYRDCFTKAELKLFQENNIGIQSDKPVKVCPE